MPTITRSVGECRGELSWLAEWHNPSQVRVAGYEGWNVTEGDGAVLPSGTPATATGQPYASTHNSPMARSPASSK